MQPHSFVNRFDLQQNFTENFKVQVGGHNENALEENEKEVGIADYYIHENFDWGTYDNDIALLRLDEDLKFNDDVQPLCLSTNDVSPQTVCLVAGWGESQGACLDISLCHFNSVASCLTFPNNSDIYRTNTYYIF